MLLCLHFCDFYFFRLVFNDILRNAIPGQYNTVGKIQRVFYMNLPLTYISIGKTPGIQRAAGIPLSVFHSWLTFKLFHDVTSRYREDPLFSKDLLS